MDAAAHTELLDLARQWHGTGAEAGLRDRTGASEPVVRVQVRDENYFQDYEQFTLGGVTVREGHGEILTGGMARHLDGVRRYEERLRDGTAREL
ncbi:hypothetical protein ACIQM3_31075 [Streptomyces sp. NPDC091271]|uniref:hypothetical protein n=1 Tax=Streptomyces sp. NPDC091271 TaxID=3365980 RepID=UPI0037F5BC24